MSPRPTTAYAQLEGLFARRAAVNDAQSMLQWDMAAMMPEGGAAARAEQLATLATLSHEILTAPPVGELLDAADAARDELTGFQAANLREMRREWLHATAVPADLVDALSRACSGCEMVWRKARPANDFASVKPALAEVLRLTREVASAKAARFGVTPYEALLDQYEPGGSVAEIERVFGELARFLPGFIAQVLERQAQRPAPRIPEGPFALPAQRALGIGLMERLGFDFQHGRLDVSHHPFCGGTPDDVRITTRYDEGDFAKSMMAVLHETGHALYELGLPREWRMQPVGRARGMSVHESQSLLVEMQVCRSRPFLEWVLPLVRDTLGAAVAGVDVEGLSAVFTRVKPDFIRVDADEATYPAHVILRFKLERALVEGQLELDDLPGAWTQGMRELLGITPPDDRRGCLQDIHWYSGAWGYFPTYTLGAMTAAQLFAAAKGADSAIAPGIARGDFTPLLAWLRANVHGKGSLLSTSELLTQATGRALDPAVFVHHLESRYLG